MPLHESLMETIKSGRRLVIFLHDNPDPDAIASGWILSQIATHLGVRSRIVYGGKISRAENRTMVQLLKVPLYCLDTPKGRIRYLKTDRYALVDTQPRAGNNSFPHERLKSHIVLDHHPQRPGNSMGISSIQPDIGCCTTMLLEQYRACGLVPSPKLATAAAYAIISETQDLEREATKQDQEALQFLFPHVQLTILGRIRHPARRRVYYKTVAKAMQEVRVSRNSCICHIGEVDSPEVVAEIADFLVAMERVTWCLVSGLSNKFITISVRTTHRRANAERVMKQMVKKIGKGGGHSMIAGGAIPCEDSEKYQAVTEMLTKRFIRQLRRKHVEDFRPLLEKP